MWVGVALYHVIAFWDHKNLSQLLINLRIILMAQFFQNLKHRNEEVRLKAARDLQRFVQTELRELPNERYQAQLDEINQCIYASIISADVHEKKGGILAISK